MPNDELPPSAPPAASRAARPDWYWSAPYIAVLIFALAMLVLVWVLQRQEGETQRNALARDVQWAEQTMRLHMQGTEDFLGQLARELAAGTLDADGFQVRANQHIANNPELVNVVWVAADQRVRWTAPFDTTDWLVGDALSAGQGAVLRRAQAARVVAAISGRKHSMAWSQTDALSTNMPAFQQKLPRLR